MDFFGSSGACPKEGDCKWSHRPLCKHGPECVQGDFCRFTHDWDNLLGTWFAEEGSVQPESEPREDSEGSPARSATGAVATEGGPVPARIRTATLACLPCGKETTLKEADVDNEHKQKCTGCKETMELLKVEWKHATGAKAKATANAPCSRRADKAAQAAKAEDAEARARFDKLARAFADETLDPKLETELRDLRTRFEEKTGRAKESTEIDSSTTAQNKALAEQQRSNNTIK